MEVDKPIGLKFKELKGGQGLLVTVRLTSRDLALLQTRSTETAQHWLWRCADYAPCAWGCPLIKHTICVLQSSSGNGASAGINKGDTVIYTSSFFGDELWPSDSLGSTRSALVAAPSPVCIVYVSSPSPLDSSPDQHAGGSVASD